MKIEPQGPGKSALVRLEPMAEPHREGAASRLQRRPGGLDPASTSFSWVGERVRPDLGQADRPIEAGGGTQAYAVMVGGEAVGLTAPGRRPRRTTVLEVGGTYYRPEGGAGVVNPAAERLMMGHAFDSGARRVVYRVDATNARTRAAVLKLGAVQGRGSCASDRVTGPGGSATR